jgi:hypothetical protein
MLIEDEDSRQLIGRYFTLSQDEWNERWNPWPAYEENEISRVLDKRNHSNYTHM